MYIHGFYYYQATKENEYVFGFESHSCCINTLSVYVINIKYFSISFINKFACSTNNRWKIGCQSVTLDEHNYLTEMIFINTFLCLLLALHRKELQELQNLYKQNSTHTAQQAELIQQLQVLSMDTQKVLRNQEDVHTAESISYQKVCFYSVIKM